MQDEREQRRRGFTKALRLRKRFYQREYPPSMKTVSPVM